MRRCAEAGWSGGSRLRATAVLLVLGAGLAARAGVRADVPTAAAAGGVHAGPGQAGAPAAVPDFAKARAAATAILARREFQAAAGPSWWDVQVAKFWSWLGRVFSGMGRLGKLAPWLGTAMEWTLFGGAAVGLLLLLRRSFARERLRVALNAGAHGLESSAWSREAEDWARMAEERAAAAEWREAVHCLYWAAIVLLESRRAWRHNPSRTPREYLRLLRAGSAQQGALRGLTGIFERAWYGLREAEEADFRRARGFFDRLSERGGGTTAETGAAAMAEGA